LIAEDPAADQYCQKWEQTLEPFFVKNLENVQGDERDVIFISTVYGSDGSGPVRQRFGPINRKHGGHRRLNVLYTRAKRRVVVYSCMEPGDIRIDETSSRGVKALQGYLKYARTGILEHAVPTGREPDSNFEMSVARMLRDKGYEVEPQVGIAGYFIDIGVRHPKHPGSFLLGIECDGAMYHSAKSTRDRDRLRQEVLERLGWTIYRIWSLDWYRNTPREMEKLLTALKMEEKKDTGGM
jgi:very-short-patch-repair endonuclease